MRVVPTAPITAPWPTRLGTGPVPRERAEAVDCGPLADKVARPWSAWLEALGVPGPVTASFQRIRAGAAVVVTGQQPVVLGGPLLVLAKAARAIRLARTLEEAWQRPVAPVFWVAGDDHDLGEMLGTVALDGNGTLHRHRLEVPQTRTAANALPVPGQASRVLEEFARETGLPRPERFAPRPGDHLSEWFTRVLLCWFGDQGLVPLDPHCLDQAAEPLFAEVLRRAGDYRSAVRAGAEELERAGVTPPLTADADPPLLVIDQGERRRVRLGAGGRMRWNDTEVTAEELLSGHRAGRWRLSANVSLRVLLQNHLLPTAAYVAGPAERRYQAQLGPLHEAFGVTPATVVARPSVTVVPRATRRHLRRLGLTAEEWFAAPPPPTGGDEWVQSGRRLQDQLRGWLEDADEALKGAIARQAGRLHQGFEQLLARADQARQEGAARQEARRAGIDQSLRPGGQPQERVVNPLSFLAECGGGLVESLLDLPVEPEGHWLLIPEDENHG